MKLGLKKKIMVLFVTAGIFLWVEDALLDYHQQRVQSIIQSLLFDAPGHDISSRVFAFLVLVTCGIFVVRYIGKFERIEQRYSHLFSSISDAIIIVEYSDPQSNKSIIREMNKHALSMLGYDEEEARHLSSSDLMITRRSPEAPLSEVVRENKYTVFEADVKRKDGCSLIAEVSVHPCIISMNQGVFLILRDITTRKRGEEALLESEKRLAVLATQLLTAQEAERMRISLGLHDELGQALMHLKFKVGTFIAKPENSNMPASAEGEGLLSYVDEIIEYVRRLSRELSPLVLEEIGLTSSIHYLVEEFCGHYKIECDSINVDEIDNILSAETELNIFRILQECLTNVARHSQATCLSVLVEKQKDNVFFKVEDNGKGFDDNNGACVKGAQRGIGIFAMQQRVRMAGGSIEFFSGEKSGACVSFTIPF